jgi:spore coat protein U-like protein
VRVKFIVEFVLILLMALCSGRAIALTNCNVTQVSSIGFGAIVPLSGLLVRAEGEIRIRCEVVGDPPIGSQVDVNIRISQGNSASYTTRRLFLTGGNSSAYQIDYNLFTDANGSRVWGDGTDGSAEVKFSITGLSGNGIVREVTSLIYGRLPSIQNTKRAGLYTDALTVSINY